MILKFSTSSFKIVSLKFNTLAPSNAGIDKIKDIFAASYLLKFSNLDPVITIPDLLAPGTSDKI